MVTGEGVGNIGLFAGLNVKSNDTFVFEGLFSRVVQSLTSYFTAKAAALKVHPLCIPYGKF